LLTALVLSVVTEDVEDRSKQDQTSLYILERITQLGFVLYIHCVG
jgi:hypothetical protein